MKTTAAAERSAEQTTDRQRSDEETTADQVLKNKGLLNQQHFGSTDDRDHQSFPLQCFVLTVFSM
jgi:hypothetical protein